MKRMIFGLLAGLLLLGPLEAQSGPPTPAPVSVLCNTCQANLAVTASSGRVALPSTAASAKALTVYNAGSKDAYFLQGDVTAVATTGAVRLPAGGIVTVWVSAGYLAAITGGADTTTLYLYQSNGPVGLRVNNGVVTATVSGSVTLGAGSANVGSVTLGAGSANVGNVGGKTVSICVAPTVTASNAYGANYIVGGLLTFPNAYTSTGTGILQGVSLNIKKVEGVTFTFWPFSANPSNTTWTDAAVANINAADVTAVRSPITLSCNSGLGTMSNCSADGIGMAMAPGATALYGVVTVSAVLTNNFAAITDVPSICVKNLQDL